jgi:hypothetical protein
MFTDEYGNVRMWVQAAAVMVVVAVIAAAIFGVVTYIKDSGSTTALVQTKQMEWSDNAWIYYFVLSNGVDQRVTYSAWQAAQPEKSYSTYTSQPGTPPEEEEATNPDETDPDTQYSVPETSIEEASDPISEGE